MDTMTMARRGPAPGSRRRAVSSGLQPVSRRRIAFRRAGGRPLHLELFIPPGSPPPGGRPAMVWWSGGGWHFGRLGVYDRQCAYLASRGVVAAQAEYRERREGKRYSAAWAAEDAKAAVGWLRVNARRFGIAPDRVAAAGESSGATMAVQTAVSEGFEPRELRGASTRPDALVLFDPPMQAAGLRGYFVGKMRMRPGVARRLIPNLNLRGGLPPAFVCWSRRDWLAPGLEEFARMARWLRLPVTARIVAGQPHGFMKVTPWNEICAGWVEEFMVSLGWLSGRPAIRPPRLPFDLARPVFGRKLWPLPDTARWDASVDAAMKAAGRVHQLSFAPLRGGGIAAIVVLGPGDRTGGRELAARARMIADSFGWAAPGSKAGRRMSVCLVGFPYTPLGVWNRGLLER